MSARPGPKDATARCQSRFSSARDLHLCMALPCPIHLQRCSPIWCHPHARSCRYISSLRIASIRPAAGAGDARSRSVIGDRGQGDSCSGLSHQTRLEVPGPSSGVHAAVDCSAEDVSSLESLRWVGSKLVEQLYHSHARYCAVFERLPLFEAGDDDG